MIQETEMFGIQIYITINGTKTFPEKCIEVSILQAKIMLDAYCPAYLERQYVNARK